VVGGSGTGRALSTARSTLGVEVILAGTGVSRLVYATAARTKAATQMTAAPASAVATYR
jgi:hypothetical protein